MGSPKSEKPADAATSNRLRKLAHLGNQRGFSANTVRPFLQPRAASPSDRGCAGTDRGGDR